MTNLEGNWKTYTVKRVELTDNGSQCIETTDSTGFCITAKRNPNNIEIKAGDTIQIKTINYSRIVGVRVCTPIFELTQEDLDKEQEEEHKEYCRQAQETYQKYLDTFPEKLMSIQHIEMREKALQEHDDLVNAVNSGKDEDYSSRHFCDYSLFIIMEADKLLDWFNTKDELTAFRLSDIDIQKEQCPVLDYANHSGNTFAMAVSLAMSVLSEQESA